MTQTVALGQAFLIRRDFVFGLNALQKEVIDSSYHREDRPEPKKDAVELIQKLHHYQKVGAQLDIAIERVNNLPDSLEFEGNKISLNEARKLKVNLQSSLATQNQIIQHLSMYSNRMECDQIISAEGILVPIQRKYKLLLDLDLLKRDAKEISKNLRTLDSLIQKADWSLQVEIPETDI